MLNKPPRVLLSALSSVQAKHIRHGHNLGNHIQAMLSKYPAIAETYTHQGQENDQLFQASYNHVRGDTYTKCDRGQVQHRPKRINDEPEIHYGNIASGDEVIKDFGRLVGTRLV